MHQSDHTFFSINWPYWFYSFGNYHKHFWAVYQKWSKKACWKFVFELFSCLLPLAVSNRYWTCNGLAMHSLYIQWSISLSDWSMIAKNSTHGKTSSLCHLWLIPRGSSSGVEVKPAWAWHLCGSLTEDQHTFALLLTIKRNESGLLSFSSFYL